MSETTQVNALLRQQIASQESRHQQQMELMQQQVQAVVAQVGRGSSPAMTQPVAAMPSFVSFDSISELWTNYWARFCMFAGANSIPEEEKAQVFLTNQSAMTYKLMSNLAVKQTPSKDINKLTKMKSSPS